jgi:hypothetical protein
VSIEKVNISCVMGDSFSDKKERDDKDDLYKEHMGDNSPIIQEFLQRWNIKNPSLEQLLAVALMVSEEHHIELDRQDKRRRRFLIGWLNFHREEVLQVLPNIVMNHPTEGYTGEMVNDWLDFQKSNPDHRLFRDLREGPPERAPPKRRRH